MFLLLDHKNNPPFQFMFLSVVMHALVFIFVVNFVSKLNSLKPFKKEIIEFEIAALSPSTHLMAKLGQTSVAENSSIKPTFAKVQKAKTTHSEIKTKSHTEDKTVAEEYKDAFTAIEDFSKLDLDGQAWSAEVDQEKVPDVVDESVDNSDDSIEDYKALHKNYANEEVDSDLNEAQNKNAVYAKDQGQKIKAAIERDSQELTKHTESLIKQEKLARVARIRNSERGNGSNPNGVRALRELKQMPGNKKPEYALADRRANKQGQVVYHAFINSEGLPEKFTLIKSSGYPSLDESTLSSLKKWRFYPGQEGWVELPFKWSLKGGAVEAPSILRMR